jgi:hypothetical protein
MNMESKNAIILADKTEELREKPVPVPLHPSEIPYGLSRVRIQSLALGPATNA